MNLQDISAEVRPRSHWAAVDFGFLLLRRRYFMAVAAIAFVVLPPFVLIELLFSEYSWVPVTVVWWCKPLWERPTLHILSRDLFGDAPSLRSTLAGFWRDASTQALASLTWRRLSATRSLDLPVVQLEGLSGEARVRRLGLLRRGDAGPGAIWLLIVCANLEIAIPLGLLALIQAFVPAHVDWDVISASLGDDGSVTAVADVLGDCLYVATVIAVAPFYVAGGFGLYVNRRTELEGWDLEIAFRRLVGRLASGRPGHDTMRVATRAAAVVCLCGVSLLGPGTLHAAPTEAAQAGSGIAAIAEVEQASAGREQAHRLIREVLSGDSFHDRDTIWVPRFVLDWDLSMEDSEEYEFPAWLESLITFLGRAIAVLSEATLVVLAALLLGYVAFQYREAIAGAMRSPSRAGRRAGVPQTVAGLDVSPESLPSDVVAEVRQRWQRGDVRDALALLYRATLSVLVVEHEVAITADATERECVLATRRHVEAERANYFTALTRAWQLTAYAHRGPNPDEWDVLCDDWTRYFAHGPRTGPPGLTGQRTDG